MSLLMEVLRQSEAPEILATPTSRKQAGAGQDEAWSSAPVQPVLPELVETPAQANADRDTSDTLREIPAPGNSPHQGRDSSQSAAGALPTRLPQGGQPWGITLAIGLVTGGLAGYFYAQSVAPEPAKASTEDWAPIVHEPIPTGMDSPHPAEAPALTSLDQAPAPAPPAIPHPTRPGDGNTPPKSAPKGKPGAPDLAPRLEQAYSALMQQDLAGASAAYQAVLEREPAQMDARIGLAAIAAREEGTEQAQFHYQKAKEAAPDNPLAIAGLESLRARNDPDTAETRLKELLSRQPQAVHAHFVLGNLYAGQHRWRDAQQSYFQAVAGDGNHPDYLFNLAVSLDHLGQHKPARRYYAAALSAGERRPGAFDQESARARIHDLEAP